MRNDLAAAYRGLRLQNQIRVTQISLQFIWLVLSGLVYLFLQPQLWHSIPGLPLDLAVASMVLTGLFSLNDLRAVYHLTAIQAAVGHRSLDVARFYRTWLRNVNAIQGFYFAFYVGGLCLAYRWSGSLFLLVIGMLGLTLLLAVILAMYMHLISLRDHFLPRALGESRLST